MDLTALVEELREALDAEAAAAADEQEIRTELDKKRAATRKCRAAVRELEEAIQNGTYQSRLPFAEPDRTTGPNDFYGHRTRARKRPVPAT
jgi:hypothetical protein